MNPKVDQFLSLAADIAGIESTRIATSLRIRYLSLIKFH